MKFGDFWRLGFLIDYITKIAEAPYNFGNLCTEQPKLYWDFFLILYTSKFSTLCS